MIKHAFKAEETELAPSEPILPTDPIAPDEHIAPVPRIPTHAFCETRETAAAVKAAGEDRYLGKAHLKNQMGGAAAAVEAYRPSPTPNVLLLKTETRSHDILASLD